MTLKREIKDAYIENGHPVYIKTHSDAVYVDKNETETLTERLDNVKKSTEEIADITTQLNAIANYPKMLYTSDITTTIVKSISGGVANWTSPQWNIKKYDTNYFIKNDNTLITIKESGIYLINLAIHINVSSGSALAIKLVKNFETSDSNEIAYDNRVAPSYTSRINLSTTCYLNQNETLKVLIYHEGQSDANLICGYGFPMISVTKIGAIE